MQQAVRFRRLIIRPASTGATGCARPRIHLGAQRRWSRRWPALLVFAVWYPYPYREISGGRDLFLLVVAVDVVLGPLITFAVFNRAKPRARTAARPGGGRPAAARRPGLRPVDGAPGAAGAHGVRDRPLPRRAPGRRSRGAGGRARRPASTSRRWAARRCCRCGPSATRRRSSRRRWRRCRACRCRRAPRPLAALRGRPRAQVLKAAKPVGAAARAASRSGPPRSTPPCSEAGRDGRATRHTCR